MECIVFYGVRCSAAHTIKNNRPTLGKALGKYGSEAKPASAYTWLDRHPAVKWGAAAAGLLAGLAVSTRWAPERRKPIWQSLFSQVRDALR